MASVQAWRAVQGAYWLALGTWFGALIMLAIAAATTFQTVAEHRPLLAPPGAARATATMFEATAQSGTALAGTIVGRSIDRLRVLQWICAAAAVAALGLQHTAFARRLPRSGLGQWMNTLRVALVLLPALILVADTVHINPQLKQQRRIRNDVIATPAQAQAARASFDRYHHLSERLLSVQVFMLGAAVLASSFALHGDERACEPRAERI